MFGRLPKGLAIAAPVNTRRRGERARIALPAAIETVTGRREVVLHDLSTTGAMIGTPKRLPIDSRIILRCGPIDAMGVVVRAGRHGFGVWFDRPVDEQDVIRLRGEGEETARSGVTPEERQAAQDWVRGVTR